MYREEPLNKQVKDLKSEVETLKGTSLGPATQLHMHMNWAEWRWPLAAVASVAIVCMSLTMPSHKPVTRTTYLEVEPGISFTRQLPRSSPTMMRGWERPFADYDCGWNNLDADDCGYASGLGDAWPACETDFDCVKTHLCVIGECVDSSEYSTEVKPVTTGYSLSCDTTNGFINCHVQEPPLRRRMGVASRISNVRAAAEFGWPYH